MRTLAAIVLGLLTLTISLPVQNARAADDSWADGGASFGASGDAFNYQFNANVMPEPSTFAFFGVGIIGLPTRFRGRRSAKYNRRRMVFCVYLAAVLLLFPMTTAWGQNWVLPADKTGDWSVASNWNAGVPTSSSTVSISNGGTVTITLPGAAYANLTLSKGWVQMSDGTLAGASPTVSNNGSFIQSGGTHTVRSYLEIQSTAPSGGYNLSAGSLSATNEAIGAGGNNGSFVQSGGANSVTGNFYLGYNATGTYDLSGSGSLSATGDESLGTYTGGAPPGNGIFTQSGGTNTVGGTLCVGGEYGSGSYTLSGSGLLTAANERVGNSHSRTGAFTQTGGTNNITNALTIGTGAQYYYLSGSGRLSAVTEYVDSGASFSQNGGVNNATRLWVGHFNAGAYSLGAGSLTASDEYIGYYPSGIGNFTHSGGTNAVGTLNVGVTSAGTGYYTLSGSAQLSATSEFVGSDGTGTFTQTGGTNTTTSLWLGYSKGNASYGISGTYNLSGNAVLSVSGTGCFGHYINGRGTFNQAGGSSSFGFLMIGDALSSSGACTLSGGTMTVGGMGKGVGTATFNFNGGTLRAGAAFSSTLPLALNTAGSNATFDTAGYNVTLSGALSGPGNLIKAGSGTLVLAAANSYTGPTAVTAGTLSLTGSLNATSDLAVGDATFNYAPAANGGTGNSQAVAGLTVNAGASTINVSNGNSLALGKIVRNTAGVVDINSNSTTGRVTTSRANTNGILGPWATYGSGTGMQYAAAVGGNVAAYTGSTSITSGVTGLTDTNGSVNYAISGGGGALTTPVSANTVWFTGASSTLTASTANPLSLNGIMNVGSGTATIGGGDLIIGATKELVITGPGNVTIQSPIRDNASGQSALTVAGSGTLLLGGANTYGGDTVVCDGVLRLGNTAALPQGAAAGNLVLYKTLDLNNFSANVHGLFGNGVVTSSVPGTPTLTVGSNDATSTFGGVIQNGTATAVALTKICSGTLSLAGNQTYTGATTVAAGKLNVTGSLAAASAVAVNGGGMLGGSGNGASTGIVNGPVTVVGGSSAAAQGALDLIDNSLGSLYLNSTLAFGGAAGNPSVLNLEYGSAGFDMVAVSGGLTLNAGGGLIHLTSLGDSPALGTYNLLTFARQTGTGTFTFPGGLSTQVIGNRRFILNNTGTAEQVIVDNGAGASWTDGGSDGNWTSAANWIGGTSPGLTNGNASVDTATFNAPTGGHQPVVIDSGRNVQNLIFDSAAGPYTIGSTSGNALLLSSGGSIQTTPLVGVTQVIAAPLVIQGSAGVYTFASNATANPLSLLGNVSGSATSGNTTQLTLDGTNTSSNTIGGTISDGPAGGSLAITKTGAGTWVLSGLNTYTGGTTLLAGALTLAGNSTAGTGPFTLVGGTLSTTNQYVGSPGVRSFTQSGGTNSAPGSLYLGYTAGTSGAYQMTGGTLAVAGGNGGPGGSEYVGYSGTGTFTQSGGTHTFSGTYDGDLYIGYNTGSLGTYEISGAGLLTAAYWEDNSNVWVGYSGTGCFTQTGGIVDLTTNLNIGYNAGGNGTYTLSSGTLIAPSQCVGYSGTGTFTQSGGKNVATGVYLGSKVGSSGTYNLNGGTLALASLTKGSGTAAFNFGGGTLQISSTCTVPINLATSGGNATIDTGSNAVTFSAPLSGAGNLIKIGSGTLTLTAPNTYLGPTNVTAGNLYVNDSLSPSSAISVSDGATLGGRGSAGNVTVAGGSTGGTVVAGQSNVGSLTLAGLTFGGKGAVNVANIGSGGDASIITAGTLTANGSAGSVTINVSGSNLFTGTYKLIGHSGAVGGTGGFGAFKLGTVPTLTGPRVGGTPFRLVNNADEIDVKVSNDYILWTGVASSQWSTATIASPKNWKVVSTNAATDYLETVSNGNDAVVFDDSAGTGPKTVDISAANVKPMNVAFGNSTATRYTLQSSGGYGITGATGLTKSGDGTLVIRTANSYTGSTVHNGGLLQIGVTSNASAIGSGPLVLAGGNLSSDGTAARTVSNAVTLDADAVLGDAVNNGPLTLSGAVTLTGNRQLGINSAVTLSGTIGGTGYGITKNGGGTLALTGANWYTGKTILNGGTLVIDSESRLGGSPNTFTADQLNLNGGTLQTTATFSIASSNRGVTLGAGGGIFSPNSSTNLTISNALAGAGTLYQTGSGTLILAGANTYSGGTMLSAGQININSTTALGAAGSLLTIAGDGTCKIDSTSNTITLSNNYPQAWNADFTFVGSRSLNLGTGQVILGGNRQVTVNGSTLTVGGVVSGNYSLTKAGAGTLALSGSNTYSGKTIVNAGALSIASEAGLGADPGSFIADQLTLSGGTLQTTANCTIGSGNRGITLGSGGGTFSPNSGTTLTAVNPIAGSGSLIKSGGGTLTLSTANTYASGTTLSEGQINLNNPAALPGGVFTISGGAIGNSSGAALALANNNLQTWTGSFKFVGPQDLDLGSGAVMLGSSPTLTVSAGTLTVEGPISGGYSLTKAGVGALVLSGANQYTGTTLITAGKLTVDGSLASTGAVTVQNGGTLGGIGSIAGLVTVNPGGHIAPGDFIGTLNLAGNLTLASGARLDFELGPVTASDQIAMKTNTLNLNGQDFSTIKFTPQAGFGPGAYTLIDAGNLTGTGLGPNVSSTISGLPAELSIGGPNGNDLVLTVVPEPSTLALLGIGAVCLFVAWRRQVQTA